MAAKTIILALVQAGTVVNIIVDDVPSSLPASYLASFQFVVPINGVPGDPGIGWTYDGNTFSPPKTSPPIIPDYVPVNIDAWSGIAPTSVSDALDRIASVLVKIP